MQIDWQPTYSHPIRSTVVNGEIEMQTGNGSWFCLVSVVVTGRTLSKSPVGDFGTKAIMTFADGARVDCWVRP